MRPKSCRAGWGEEEEGGERPDYLHSQDFEFLGSLPSSRAFPSQELANSGNSRRAWGLCLPSCWKKPGIEIPHYFPSSLDPISPEKTGGLRGNPLLAASLLYFPLSKLRPGQICPGCSPPPFLRLLEEEALPGKYNTHHKLPVVGEKGRGNREHLPRLAIAPGSVPGRARSRTTAWDGSGLQPLSSPPVPENHNR